MKNMLLISRNDHIGTNELVQEGRCHVSSTHTQKSSVRDREFR